MLIVICVTRWSAAANERAVCAKWRQRMVRADAECAPERRNTVSPLMCAARRLFTQRERRRAALVTVDGEKEENNPM